jgi:trk system potassium uptake protein TrkH
MEAENRTVEEGSDGTEAGGPAPEPPTRGLPAFLKELHPTTQVLLGYLSYVAIGWGLLCVPWMQTGAGVGALDNLFIATSAMSTTGLTTVSIADRYNFAGQLIVMALIQLGGIGYMTFGSFVALSGRSELTPLRSQISQTVFSLPRSFRMDRFIRSVILFTVAIEAVGAGVLYVLFARAGAPRPLWNAVFHSVSAFCTAGFGLFNDSFESYAGDFWMNLTLTVLSYLGAVGFIVFVDWWRVLTGESRRMTLTSRIILWSTFWLGVAGTGLLFLCDTTLRDLPVEQRLMAAGFQAMTAQTTVGFDTVPIGTLSRGGLLVLMVLMLIGASPSGTGGGLKVTTFSAIVGVMRSALAGRQEVRFWNRVVPLERVWTAVASLGFYVTMLVAGTFLLELTEDFEFERTLFEATSALGTVGLSTGITGELSALGKLVIIFLMLCGRVGPLTFGIALFFRRATPEEDEESDLAV